MFHRRFRAFKRDVWTGLCFGTATTAVGCASSAFGALQACGFRPALLPESSSEKRALPQGRASAGKAHPMCVIALAGNDTLLARRWLLCRWVCAVWARTIINPVSSTVIERINRAVPSISDVRGYACCFALFGDSSASYTGICLFSSRSFVMTRRDIICE